MSQSKSPGWAKYISQEEKYILPLQWEELLSYRAEVIDTERSEELGPYLPNIA